MSSKVPSGLFHIPGPLPDEPIPKHQPLLSIDRKVLDESFKLKLLGSFASSIPARVPEIAPDEPGIFFQVDSHALRVAAASEGNGRPWYNYQHSARLHADVP